MHLTALENMEDNKLKHIQDSNCMRHIGDIHLLILAPYCETAVQPLSYFGIGDLQ